MTIFTIGHSTRPLDVFLGLLREHGIEQVADIRTVPKSARNPQFNGDVLSEWLVREGLVYQHLGRLGGLRHARSDSINTAWKNDSFRGYADYMGTQGFRDGLGQLVDLAGRGTTVIMCAEAVWWRCHRRLVADALSLRGISVRHIVGAGPAERHELTEFARIEDGRLSYPGLL